MTGYPVNIVWTKPRLDKLAVMMAEKKSTSIMAEKLGLTEIQVKRRVGIINNQRKKDKEDSEKPTAIDYATIEIKSIKDAATTLGAKNIGGSYYLNGKRILVGAMIRKARGI